MISWYPFYVGDYIRKTAHLSLLEHGAYRLLIDHYMATRSPLPNDNAKLYRICRARTPSERRSVMSVVSEFFIKDGTLLRSRKCDSELDKQLIFSNSQSAKAKLRHSYGNAGDVPTTTTKKEKEINNKEKYSYGSDFLSWWEAYPKNNGSKKDAWKAYQSAVKTGVKPEDLLSGAQKYSAYAVSSAMDIKYIKHASTWINKSCWEIDYLENNKSKPASWRDNPMNKMPSPAGG